MNITHEEEKGMFILFNDEGQECGHITYIIGDEGELRATHTKVFSCFKNKGYANLLLDALVEYAVSNDLVVVPVCSYVVQSFEKNPDRYALVKKHPQ